MAQTAQFTLARALAGATLGLAAAHPTLAETATTTTSTALDDITIEGEGEGESTNANAAESSIEALGGALKEIPKTVTVVSKKTLEAQKVTTLEQALRNVPGITASTGEGNGGVSGDQFRIRGISSSGDIYQDGLRDFGLYVRDTFNTESVQVVKGATGAATGTGSTAGVINSTTKRAHLGNSGEAAATLSTGTNTRETLDLNKQLSETSALRLNVMAQQGDAAGRDNVSVARQGVAVDFGAGIGTDLEWHLGLSHQRNDGTPDFGQPMATGADGIMRPLATYGIAGYDTSTSYVRSTDMDVSHNTALSGSIKYDIREGLTLKSETRYTKFDRATVTSMTPSCSTSCLALLTAGTDATGTRGAGGGVSYALEGYGLQNVTTADLTFDTGALHHEAQIGVDVSKQDMTRYSATFSGLSVARTAATSLLNPAYDATGTVDFNTKAWETASFNAGLFISDKISFAEKYAIAAAVRADHFDNSITMATGTTAGVEQSSSDNVLSPSLAFFYEPNAETTIYLSAARSYRPQAADPSTLTGASAAQLLNTAYVEPEQSDTIELGTKIDLMEGRLGLTAALYQIDKANSYIEDTQATAGFQDAGRRLTTRGVELGLSGDVTEALDVSLAYAYTDGALKAPIYSTTFANADKAPAGISKHSVSLWGNYELADGFAGLEGKVTLGGGLRYASKYWANDANTAEVPANFAADAAVAYEVEDWKVSLNAYNLTDHTNYTSSFSGRATPEAGRSFALGVARKF